MGDLLPRALPWADECEPVGLRKKQAAKKQQRGKEEATKKQGSSLISYGYPRITSPEVVDVDEVARIG